MAGANRTQTPSSQPAFDEVRQELNKLNDDLELLRAQFNLHQHAALNAAPSTNTVLAASLKSAKVVL